MQSDQAAHQMMTELFKRAIDDGKKLYPDDSAAYALSVMSACLGTTMKVIMRKCSETEINVLKQMLEHTVNISEDLARRDT